MPNPKRNPDPVEEIDTTEDLDVENIDEPEDEDLEEIDEEEDEEDPSEHEQT